MTKEPSDPACKLHRSQPACLRCQCFDSLLTPLLTLAMRLPPFQSLVPDELFRYPKRSVKNEHFTFHWEHSWKRDLTLRARQEDAVHEWPWTRGAPCILCCAKGSYLWIMIFSSWKSKEVTKWEDGNEKPSVNFSFPPRVLWYLLHGICYIPMTCDFKVQMPR